MTRPNTTATLIQLPFSALTKGQQNYEARKILGKSRVSWKEVKGISPDTMVTIASDKVTSKQNALPAGATRTQASARRRTRGARNTAPSQAGSATKLSEMKIADYSQRGLPLKLVYGNGQQVASHLGTLPNKEAIAMIAIDDTRIYANGKFPWAAALYVDGFVANFENAKQALPTQFAKGIIEALNAKSVMKQVSYLNFLAKFGNGLCYVNASKSLKGTPAVRSFMGALWASVFAKGDTVLGTRGTEITNTVVLLGDNGPRIGYAWVGENFSCVPSAFPEKDVTHHTVGEDFLIEFVPGTTSFRGVNAQQMWDAVHSGQAPEMLAVSLDKIDGKVIDLSVVSPTPHHGFVAIASLEGGKNGYVPFTIDLSGKEITLKAIQTLGVSTEVAKTLGGMISRFSSQGITMTSLKGDDIVKRLPVNYQPAELRGMVTSLYQAAA